MKNYINEQRNNEPKTGVYFKDFINQTVQKKQRRFNQKYQRPYKTLIYHLDNFSNKFQAEIFTNSVNEEFLDDFIVYLENNELKQTYIKSLLGLIKNMVKKAGNYGYAIDQSYDDVEVKDEDPFSIYLSMNEITRIYYKGLSKKQEQIKDLFVVGCLTGLRYSDYSTLTKLDFNDNFIQKTTQKTYILDITDVDNWSETEDVGKRIVAKFKYKKTDGTTNISGVPNEFLLAPDNTFYAFTFLMPSGLMEFELPALDFFTVPTVTTLNMFNISGGHQFDGFILNDGGQPIISRGFRYGLAADTLDTTVMSSDTTPGFSATISTLTPGIYFYQAFATNAEGESISQIKQFNTEDSGYKYKTYIIVSRVVI